MKSDPTKPTKVEQKTEKKKLDKAVELSSEELDSISGGSGAFANGRKGYN
jgi:hypothetical protein